MNARRRFRILLEKQGELVKASEHSPFNSILINARNRRLGVIASGVAYNYVLENLRDIEASARPSFLKVTTYPLPEEAVGRLVRHVEKILVVEEGYPFIEKILRGMFGIHGREIRGKLTGHLPLTGELNPDLVRRALDMDPLPGLGIRDFHPAARPPQLCRGCSHADTYRALNEALASNPGAVVFSDIGCYTLGALPPYNAIQTCVCMGASVGMAKGGAEAGVRPSVAVIGDSTFAHSGLTPLLAAAAVDADMTVIILDNATVAMTGGQPTFASGEKLERMVEGLGVDGKHIRRIIPLPKNHEQNVLVMKEEFAHQGLSVIISSRECVQQARRRKRKGSA